MKQVVIENPILNSPYQEPSRHFKFAGARLSRHAIERKIYLIRGQKVMLDRDLSELYGVETRALNQAVRRNLDRFPQDFVFSLTREEILNISQFVISSGGRIKHAPNVFAFTEAGSKEIEVKLFRDSPRKGHSGMFRSESSVFVS